MMATVAYVMPLWSIVELLLRSIAECMVQRSKNSLQVNDVCPQIKKNILKGTKKRVWNRCARCSGNNSLYSCWFHMVLKNMFIPRKVSCGETKYKVIFFPCGNTSGSAHFNHYFQYAFWSHHMILWKIV